MVRCCSNEDNTLGVEEERITRFANWRILAFLWEGFCFVDKRFEISNLELIRDMDCIIKLTEIL